MKPVLPPEPPAPPAPPAPPSVLVSAPSTASGAQRRVRRDELLGIDPRAIYQDVEARPDHYSEEQRALAESLIRDRGKAPKTVAPRELMDLVMTFFRSTKLREATREIIAKETSKDVGVDSTFEDQDFGPTIRVI